MILWIHIKVAAQHKHKLNIKAHRTAVCETILRSLSYSQLDLLSAGRISDTLPLPGSKLLQVFDHIVFELLERGVSEGFDLVPADRPHKFCGISSDLRCMLKSYGPCFNPK